jgi:flagellar protein FlgJ
MLSAVHDRLAVDVADAQALKAKAVSGDRAALVGAAKQFESLLVSQMLKNMRQTRFSDEDDPMNSGEGLKLYQDLLDQQWATQLSKGRGLGFADMMVKAMEKQSAVVSSQLSVEGTKRTEAATLPSPLKPSANPQLTTDNSQLKTGFISRMRPHAEAAAADTGVPAQFILAQAALESGWGRHEIKDAEGQTSHNLFGIKAGRSWDGAVAETLTTEYRQGVPMKLSQRFRAYADYGSAFTDYANLLKARYGSALEGGADPSTFTRGLVAGGYATDPSYGDKLQAVIAKVGNHLAMAGN